MLDIDSFTHTNIHVAGAVNLMMGIIFSPLSSGLYYYLIYTIFYEIFTLVTCQEWDIFDRLYIVVMGVLGWVIGRLCFRIINPDRKRY